ncbi:MAG: 50S ribosomal protein L21, partial [Planctomycetaceae bacterium]
MAKAAAETAAGMKGAGHEYAIVVDGGRQYRVMAGQELEIDFRHQDDGSPLPAGTEVVFDEVLAVSKAGTLTLGKPKVKGASVKAEVLGLVQGEKIYVQKFKRRKNYRRRTGHRSLSTKV